jgi:hypothetical protein
MTTCAHPGRPRPEGVQREQGVGFALPDEARDQLLVDRPSRGPKAAGGADGHALGAERRDRAPVTRRRPDGGS